MLAALGLRPGSRLVLGRVPPCDWGGTVPGLEVANGGQEWEESSEESSEESESSQGSGEGEAGRVQWVPCMAFQGS